jgi:nucleotide-binding universal stress UspA family protein
MLDPILVPLDGSLLAECVLPHVVAIARAFNAKVTLLRVLGQNQDPESTQSCDPLNWQINKAEARLYLETIGARLQAAGVQTQITVLEGLVPDGIIGYAQINGMNLIILSSHGHSGLSQWGTSSVVQKIILSAPTSLFIVRAQQPMDSALTKQPYRRLLVPLDGSRRAEYGLPMITRLAVLHKSEVHLVHVVKKPEMARQMPPTQEDIDLSNRIVVRNQEEAAYYLDQLQLRSPLEGVAAQTHLLISDNIAAALHEFVEREQIDMVMLSAHGYSGNTQWPYGSVVNNFMSYSPVPLLVVQDSPIQNENHPTSDVAARESIGH